MTNFLLSKPSAVFIHIPKTGGTSIQKAWPGKISARFFGHIPCEFRSLPSFTVVREPKARFLSAFRMFKYGNLGQSDYYAEPRWPDLTISKALEVIQDPWIGYDRSQRSLEWNLKHHLIPQTHPFNCLEQAQTVLRWENLESDFAKLTNGLEISVELPHLRKSLQADPEQDEWSSREEDMFLDIFAEDYARLGYSAEEAGIKVRKTQTRKPLSREEPDLVFELWSAYFSDAQVLVGDAERALPSPDVPLEPFVDTIIPGSPTRAWAGRTKDLISHFHLLQPEFGGASRLAHLLCCTIVVLRRAPQSQTAQTLFWRIIDEQIDAIRSELSLRWLTSVADTISDFGRSSGERMIGLSGSILANSTKIYESEIKMFYPKRPWPPRRRFSSGGELFDGIITYWTEGGDLIDNLFGRVRTAAGLEPSSGLVLREIVNRLEIGPTAYRRLKRIAGEKSVPMLEDDISNRLSLMAKKHL